MPDRSQLTRRAAAVLLITVLAILGLAFVGPVQAADVLTIDEDTPLTDEETIETFQEGDPVTVDVDEVMMEITVAHEPEQVNLSAYRHPDIGNHYLEIDYDESIDRDIRFYIPAEYWSPYPKDDLESAEGNVSITMRPTRDGEYTAVTISVTDPTEARFVISQEAAALYAARDYSKDLVNNSTGIEIPSLAAETQWQYIDESELSGNNTTVAIDTGGERLLLQYDAHDGPEENWVPVHECDGGSAPVCSFSRSGMDDTVFVLAKETPSPPVRYKIGGSTVDQVLGSLRELTEFDRRLKDLFGGFKDIIPW